MSRSNDFQQKRNSRLGILKWETEKEFFKNKNKMNIYN